MQNIVKYVKASVVVAGALVAFSVASPSRADGGGGGGSGNFCTTLEGACEADNGTSLLCVETAHLAECSGGVREHFDNACTHFAPNCRIVEVTDLVQACTCL